MEKRITVHLMDGTEKEMAVDSITVDGDNIIHFGRADLEFLAAPRENVAYWEGIYHAGS